MTRTYTHQGITVPYITAWSAEQTLAAGLERRHARGGPCLAYTDESPYDRDAHGALWVRQSIARGRGTADFAAVHALRQRQAAVRLLCQVCGTDTLINNPDRQLFVLRDAGQPVTEGETTTAPPLCPPCAQTSVRECPHLRNGYVAAWCRPQVWGVAGLIYDPKTLHPIPKRTGHPATLVAYTDPLIRWTLASRHVSILHDVTPVRLDELSASPPP